MKSRFEHLIQALGFDLPRAIPNAQHNIYFLKHKASQAAVGYWLIADCY
jgi:hypothetical protein